MEYLITEVLYFFKTEINPLINEKSAITFAQGCTRIYSYLYVGGMQLLIHVLTWTDADVIVQPCPNHTADLDDPDV